MTHTLLVTGATGFIGRFTVAELTRRGHRVVALMRRPERLTAYRRQIAQCGGQPEHVDAVKGDLALPRLGWNDNLPAALAGVDRVLHLGAVFDWRLKASEAHQVNTLGSEQLAAWAADQGAEMVTVSGFMVHNREHLGQLGIDADSGAADWRRVYRRAGAYEASKLEAHFRTLAVARQRALPLTVVSPGTVAGHSRTGELPDQQPFAMLIHNLAAGRLSLVPGGPHHWLPLIAVDTLAQILAHSVEDSDTRGQALIALDSRTPPLKALLEQMARILDCPPPRGHLAKGVIRAALRIPAMEQWMNTPRESMDFIQTQRFDTSALDAFMARHELEWPAMAEVLRQSAIAVGGDRSAWAERSTGAQA
ncbi:SDR family oxidoreductase [Marinobacteraceae bacterium S3BR75-40.1]